MERDSELYNSEYRTSPDTGDNVIKSEIWSSREFENMLVPLKLMTCNLQLPEMISSVPGSGFVYLLQGGEHFCISIEMRYLAYISLETYLSGFCFFWIPVSFYSNQMRVF